MKEPTPDKLCKAFGDLISPYFDGQLTDPQMNQVEAHLKECPLCARQLEHYRLMRNLLNVEKLNSPVDLTTTVMSTAEREQLLTGLDELTTPPTGAWTKILRTVAAVAMIVLVVYAGVLVVQFAGNSSRQLPTRPTFKRSGTETGRGKHEYPPAKTQSLARAKPSSMNKNRTPTPALLAKIERDLAAAPGVQSNQPLVLRPSTQKIPVPVEAQKSLALDAEMIQPETPTRPAAPPAAFQTLDAQIPLPLQIRLWAPDLPSWMLLREQVLEIFKQTQIPTLLDPEQIPLALREGKAFFYPARKGLDLAPGAAYSEFLVLLDREQLRKIHTHLQLSTLETIRQEWRPDLQKILTTQPVQPQVTVLGRQTRAALTQYFTRKGISAVETSQPTTTAASAPGREIKGMNETRERIILPVLFTIEMPPRTPPATSSAPTTTTSAPATLPTTTTSRP